MHPSNRLAHWNGLAELHPDLVRLLSTRCRNLHDVDDVVQESLVRAARFCTGGRSPRALRPWLMRIGLNVLSEHRRRASEREAEDLDDLEVEPASNVPDPSDAADEPEIWVRGRPFGRARVRALVAAALTRLPERDRVALVGVFLSERSRADVARTLGVSDALLKVRLFRAKERLRRVLGRTLEAAA
jgi:RNA polymerase sigma-70 factor (ECF subfamily)